MDVFAQVLATSRPALLSAATSAGSELGLFAALKSPRHARELASALGLEAPKRLRALVDLLVFEGLIKRREDGRLESVVTPPRSPTLGQGLGWDALAEVIRSDRPVSVVESTSAHHRHLLGVGERAAQNLFATAPLSAVGGLLLDVGSGAGAYSSAFLQRGADNRATVVDSQPVLALARENLAVYGQRITYVEGDFLKVSAAELPQEADAVLLANVLHLHGERVCRALIARASAALAPGGVLIVKDLPMLADRSGPAIGLYFAVNMALYTADGDVYSESQIVGWMVEAGLAVKRVELQEDALVLIGRSEQSSLSN